MDKLDTRARRDAAATTGQHARGSRVNGPDDKQISWDATEWRKAEKTVRRLRQRIFTASKAGDLKQVRNLQKLMLRSRSNAVMSVRRVTEVNAGRSTAGVDGQVVTTATEKVGMARWLQKDSQAWGAMPVKRVYIPKANGKRRPLGIPVVADRALQALAVNALEPEWEARFERKSYGFRPGRGCHDAIEAIFATAKGRAPTRPWVLDADLVAAFDRIDHDHLLSSLGTFPARGLVAQWLTAGIMEDGEFTPSTKGSPQGGVISPLLMNVALHGMEQAAGVHYVKNGGSAGTTRKWCPVLVRYADDLVVFCHTRDGAKQVKDQLATWLAPRGLTFNEEKTRIAHLDEGFDFLGFNVRRYHGKLLIKPSAAALQRIRRRLTTEVRSLRGVNAEAVIARLNPIIRGWAAYYRIGVSSEAFHSLDQHVWQLLYSWARHRHGKKSKHWITSRYFGQFHPTRRDRWVFGDRDTGWFLTRFAWTKIVRHTMVKGAASPDDPSLTEYWEMRRKKKQTLPGSKLTLLRQQTGRCRRCGSLLLYAHREPHGPEDWEEMVRGLTRAIRTNAIAVEQTPGPRTNKRAAFHLVHGHCQVRNHAETPTGLA